MSAYQWRMRWELWVKILLTDKDLLILTDCWAPMQWCKNTQKCENSQKVTDQECCGAEGRYCAKTAQCEIRTSFFFDCSKNLIRHLLLLWFVFRVWVGFSVVQQDFQVYWNRKVHKRLLWEWFRVLHSHWAVWTAIWMWWDSYSSVEFLKQPPQWSWLIFSMPTSRIQVL